MSLSLSICYGGKRHAGKKVLSNQYSLTEYYSPVQKGEVQLPAIYFLYDLSPIMVSIKDAKASLAHLLVRLCAVIGGVFAITGGLLATQAVSALTMTAAVLHNHCLLQSYCLLLVRQIHSLLDARQLVLVLA